MGNNRFRQVKKPGLRIPGKSQKRSKLLVIKSGFVIGSLKTDGLSKRVEVYSGRYEIVECQHPFHERPCYKIVNDPRGDIYLIISMLPNARMEYSIEDDM